MRCHWTWLLAGSCLILAAGCQRRAEQSEPAADQVSQRMQAIQTELSDLQEQLRLQLPGSGRGRGAYAGGPRSIAGTETVLERLHRTEMALNEAQQALSQANGSLTHLREIKSDQESTIEDLSAKAERLRRAEDRRMTALQDRNALLGELEETKSQLIASELARLESEQRYYELVTSVIRLDPSQTQDFFDLQRRLRESARAHTPLDLAEEPAP